jgi:hypothetical protein
MLLRRSRPVARLGSHHSGWGVVGERRVGRPCCSLGREPVDIAGRPCDRPRLGCEPVSVAVVRPLSSTSTSTLKEARCGSSGRDVHRDFCEVAICLPGERARSAGESADGAGEAQAVRREPRPAGPCRDGVDRQRARDRPEPRRVCGGGRARKPDAGASDQPREDQERTVSTRARSRSCSRPACCRPCGSRTSGPGVCAG